MGRPRALKNKDVVPSVKIDSSKTKKHKKFDDEDQDEEDLDYVSEQRHSMHDDDEDNDDDDNEPEEVVQDEIQIRTLKEEVENLFSVQKESKRRRKFTKEVKILEDNDEYLDEKDLQIIGKSKRDKPEADDTEQSQDEDENEDGDATENSVGLKRKIGKLEVAIIGNASMSDFRMNTDAEKFVQQHRAKVKRTRYTTFMSQRRPAPAKVFRVKAGAK